MIDSIRGYMGKSDLTLLAQSRDKKSPATGQQSRSSQVGIEKYGRKSRKELFLDAMDELVPWSELEAVVEPHYPKASHGGRPAALSVMLRVFFVQQWFKVSDSGIEEALYDSVALRRFAGVDLARAPAPDVTTVSRFRLLLEAHELDDKIIETVARHLDEKGIRVSKGAISDASIIYAPG
jgi:IS5 family transposase